MLPAPATLGGKANPKGVTDLAFRLPENVNRKCVFAIRSNVQIA